MTEDRINYRRAGFDGRAVRGARPAILVVDFSYGFTDPVYPTAADMTPAVAATRRLLDIAREQGIPIVFTTIAFNPAEIHSLPWLRKATGMATLLVGSRLVEIDGRLGRRENEALVVKRGASAFHGTDLATMLTALRVDTVVVAGATTSGCVRASVVDAVQSGFDVLVPRVCVADRAEAPHEANLFDMQQKYADVVEVEDVETYLMGCGEKTATQGQFRRAEGGGQNGD